MKTDEEIKWQLGAGEFACIRDLIAIQYADLSAAKLEYTAHFAMLTRLGHIAGGLTNSSYQDWARTFFSASLSNADIIRMMIIDQYRQFAGRGVDYFDLYKPGSEPWISMWHAFLNGWRWRDRSGDQDQHCGPGVDCPGYPLFKDKFTDAINSYRSVSPEAIDICQDISNTRPGHDTAKKKLDTWIANNSDALPISKAWSAGQLIAATALQEKSNLSNDQYLFIFFLLFALPAGDEAAKTLAALLSKQVSDTQELPNDSFINHLFYLVLLHLANPQGTHKLNHGQLVDFLNGMTYALPKTMAIGGVPELLMLGLNKKLTVLNLDRGYPYVGMPGLSARMREERVALDAMRAAAKASPRLPA